MNQQNICRLRYLPHIASLNKQQGNSVLCKTNYNHTILCQRNVCCAFPNLQDQTNQLHVQGVQ